MSYDSEVLVDVPVGYWPMQETTGTNIACHASVVNYTLKAGTTYTGNVIGGAPGCTLGQASLLATQSTAKSVLFSRTGSATDTYGGAGINGGTGGVRITNHTDWNLFNTSFSYEAWVKTAACTQDWGVPGCAQTRHNDAHIITHRATSPMQASMMLGTVGTVNCTLWGGYDTNVSATYQPSYVGSAPLRTALLSDFTSDSPLVIHNAEYTAPNTLDGNPHHLVATYDLPTRTLRVYFDGVCARGGTTLPSGLAIPTNTVDKLYIGSVIDNAYYAFIGWISHAAVYRTALTADRVLAHYFAGAGNAGVIHLDYMTIAPITDIISETITTTPTQVVVDAPLLRESLTFAHTFSEFLPVSIAITESFGVSSAVAPGSTSSNTITETITATGVADGIPAKNELLTDSTFVGESISIGQVLQDAFREGLSIRLAFSNGESDYVGWTMNANTGAVSNYDNYTFNSFYASAGKYYGVRSDGIYELTGKLDGTQPIDASVLLPNTDFGSPNLKRVAHAYLGVFANGGMSLRVVTGDNEEHVYSLDRENGVIREARVEFGRGLRSRYWQLELKNIDGADFILDEIELLLNTTTRRA